MQLWDHNAYTTLEQQRHHDLKSQHCGATEHTCAEERRVLLQRQQQHGSSQSALSLLAVEQLKLNMHYTKITLK